MASKQLKNIVISGTNMWNPGDDFVRDGVIRILHELFAGYQLNFIFYNFNQDFFPQSKFTGISNMVSKGDLEQCGDFIDYVVVAGLSAGTEIKDLYQWVIDNRMVDRVFLIGAGYENSYVEKYIYEEPEATIFRNTKVITGRTRKTPKFITDLNLPFYHINCPALLSVPAVKPVPPGKTITRVGMSLQLPHEQGVSNHCCTRQIYDLGIKILFELKKKYDVEIVAHHKSEYFHFLNLLKGHDIPVVFSSFYHDLFDIYPRYDLVVTTRLHSSLFANGFGIPGIIINDTDRHTHCLEGFVHSSWVNNFEAFTKEFVAVLEKDLHKVAVEMDDFKKNLIQKYLDVLSGPFGIAVQPESIVSMPCIAELLTCICATDVKRRVHEVMTKLTPDVYLSRNIETFEAAIKKGGNWFDSVTFLNWFASTHKPANYIEVGVRRGRSMAQVVTASPDTRCYGFDMWIPGYSGVENPGPDFVLSELERLGARQRPELIIGDSHVTLPVFLNSCSPELFDLVFIDGDHSYEGAKQDLELVFPRIAPGGALLFDDIAHVSHPKLYPLWQEYKLRFPDYLFIEDFAGNGTAVAFTPPFDRLNSILSSSTILYQLSEQKELPTHFFTIVLNGEPFIRYHIDVLSKLPFKWHWHIVEGVADLKHDTAWSVASGGKITAKLHNNGLSNDGTSEYLDAQVRKFPNNVSVYRKQARCFWDGKLEMVNEPLQNINEQCLLWQIDVDELWTVGQLSMARRLFMDHPEKTAAYYYCHFFVGPHLVISSRDTYGNHTNYEWLRTWKFEPGNRWIAHEPPKLCSFDTAGNSTDIATVNPIRHEETERKGLVFQHFAYAIETQLRFKESYYGYSNAIKHWKHLQNADRYPVLLRNYFPWVTDDALVNTIDTMNVVPLINFDNNSCIAQILDEPTRLLWLRTDSIGDTVLASSMLAHVYQKFGDAAITVFCQEHIAELYESSPYVHDIIPFNKQRALGDNNYRENLLLKLQLLKADICLNTVFSRELITDYFAVGCGARQRIAFNGDLANISADEREVGNRLYTMLVPSQGENIPELERYADYLEALGISPGKLEPQCWTTADDSAFAEEFFHRHTLVPGKTIAFFPKAQYDIRLYDRYGESLREICRSAGLNIIGLGGKSDYGCVQEHLDYINAPSYNLCGSTSLRQSAEIVRRCRLALGAETALAHIACAVGTTNVVVLGGGHFGRFMPYSSLTSVVCLPLECYGCYWKCKYGQPYCIQSIAPEIIQKAVKESLNNISLNPRVHVQSGINWLHSQNKPTYQESSIKLIKIPVDVHLQEFDTIEQTDIQGQLIVKCYCINLDHRADRWQDCLKEFVRIGIPAVTRVSARVEAGHLQDCAADHCGCVAQSMLDHDDMCLIMEDDVSFTINSWSFVENAISELSKLDPYWEMLFLGINADPDELKQSGPPQKLSKNLYRILSGFATHAYIVRSSAFHKIIEVWQKNRHLIIPHDVVYSRVLLPSVRAYCVNPLMALQRPSFSQHLGKYVNYNFLISRWEDAISKEKNPTIQIPEKSQKKMADPRNFLRISIVTPSYNQADFLEECIDSILSQNYPNLEYIIMDGGSTDGSVEIIKKYEQHLAYWQSKPDGGHYNAVNEGFSRTTGDIMGWLNSDDMFHQDGLWVIADIFQSRSDVRFLTGRRVGFDEQGLSRSYGFETQTWSRKLLLEPDTVQKHLFVMQEATYWRRDLWDESGASLNTAFKFAADYELWLRMLRYTSLHTVDALVAGFRLHGENQRSQASVNEYLKECIQAIQQESKFVSTAQDQYINAPTLICAQENRWSNLRKAVEQKNLYSCDASYPRISVVTPSYNQANFLEECIISVLSQNYPNLEYVVMDGGSTDGSVEIIKKYEKHLAYWQSKPDGGQYQAIAEGFTRTSGEIMTWLNSDDKFHPDAFETVADVFIKRQDVEWIMGRPNGFDQNGLPSWQFDYLPLWSREKYLNKDYKKPYIQQEGTFWRRNLWEKAGAYLRSDLEFAGDLELWSRFFRFTQLHTVDALLAGFRKHSSQKTQNFLDQYNREGDQVLDSERELYLASENKVLMPAPEPIKPERSMADSSALEKPAITVVSVIDPTKILKPQVTPAHNIANRDLLALIPPDSRSIVEIGCKLGSLANAFRTDHPAAEYVGIDVSPDNVKVAEKYCTRAITGDIEKIEESVFESLFPSDCWIFDVCLEHLQDPWSVLRRIRERIDPGGCLLVCIHNAQHWSVQMRLATGRFNYEDSGLLDRTHLRWFTRITMIEMFQSTGWKIEQGLCRNFNAPQQEQMLEAIAAMAKVGGFDPALAVQDAKPYQYVYKVVPTVTPIESQTGAFYDS